MNAADARALLAGAEITSDDAFNLIDFVHRFWQTSTDEPEALDLVVRVADSRETLARSLSGSGDMIDDVMRFAGLYPYINSEQEGANSLVKHCMRLPGFADVTFHKAQIEALSFLLKGSSLILSAPTSFGKSLLVDVTIRTLLPRVVVIVVPTLALLDEYRRRLKRTFHDYHVVTRVTEIPNKDFVIFLGTQERIEERDDIGDVELFVIDEFYKLDLKREDERSASLNNVMSKYARQAKQIYLLGPSISSVKASVDEDLSFPFLRSNFSPVAVDTERISTSNAAHKAERLADLLAELRGEPTLVYLRSPRSTYKCGIEVIRPSALTGHEHSFLLSNWVNNNYHSEWILGDCLERGVGIHHGRVPRALAQYQISLFNDGIDTILCTSSMIEGVNTKAKNVIIYDNHISKNKLDRFTFDNIKGRAGRMFQHFVGKVFLFGDAPLGEDLEVEIPLFDGFSNASDEIVVSMPVDALSASARRRRDRLISQSGLSPELMRRWARYGIDGLSNLAEEFADRKTDSFLVWKGQGSFDEIEAVFDLAWRHLQFSKHNIRSGRQAAFYVTRLRSSSSIKSFLELLSKARDELSYQLEIDDGLNFLRASEFTLPQVLMAIQDIADELGIKGCDYRILAGRLPVWFYERDYQSFEENGIPFPTAREFDISWSELREPSYYRELINRSSNIIDKDILYRWLSEEFSA